jgi:hypothetical protein
MPRIPAERFASTNGVIVRELRGKTGPFWAEKKENTWREELLCKKLLETNEKLIEK